jgi:hypothetical protein
VPTIRRPMSLAGPTSRLVAAAVAVAVALTSLGGVGTAGAASTPGGTPTAHPAAAVATITKAERHFSCPEAVQALADVKALRSRLAAKAARLSALEAKAGADRKPKARAYRMRSWDKALARQMKHQAHVLNPRFLSRVAKVSALVSSRCDG